MPMSKQLIASSFKKLLCNSDYRSIAIEDIVSGCNIVRRTFYNHFKDKEDLVSWIYETEVLSKLKVPTPVTWHDNIYRSIQAMYEDRVFYSKVFSEANPDSHWGHRMEFAVYAYRSVIENYLAGRRIPETTMQYISNFYAIGYVNTLFIWAQNGMKESPEYLTQRLIDMVDHGLYFAIDHAEDEYKAPE